MFFHVKTNAFILLTLSIKISKIKSKLKNIEWVLIKSELQEKQANIAGILMSKY